MICNSQNIFKNDYLCTHTRLKATPSLWDGLKYQKLNISRTEHDLSTKLNCGSSQYFQEMLFFSKGIL